jgi:hypothetical protein
LERRRWEGGGLGLRGWGGRLHKREGIRGRGWRPKAREGGGRLHKGKGWLGLGELVGRIKNHDPTRSRVNSRPRRTSLTKILLFYWRMLPNNSKLQKRTARKRSKKTRKNKLQLLFFANWLSHHVNVYQHVWLNHICNSA